MFITELFVDGFLFRDSKPRPLLSIYECSNCLYPDEVTGLFASVVIQKKPGVIPNVLLETNKMVVFKPPRHKHRIHYMFVPKKDIHNSWF